MLVDQYNHITFLCEVISILKKLGYPENPIKRLPMDTPLCKPCFMNDYDRLLFAFAFLINDISNTNFKQLIQIYKTRSLSVPC
jgi:hypothetical protein